MSGARLLQMAATIAGLTVTSNIVAEPNRAEELEHLRIDTGYIIEAGELEVNIVPSYFDYDGERRQEIEAELEYAISDRLMVEVEVPYRRMSFDGAGEDIDGAGNVELGAKWLLAEGENFSGSFGVGVALPSSDDRPGISDDLWGVDLSVPFTLRFPDRSMSLHVEAGMEWKEQEGFEEQLLNVAIERRPDGRNITLQLGSNIVHEESDWEAYLIPAFEIAATAIPFQFGMGVAAGLTSESADWGLLADFEVEF
ncbi:MAG TPA: hypothetical protein VGD45_12135 [Steroidobacter sp.]|uniref:hypothetical protein n=1 Tax=Steroidobacter sp. TaxID=1978227 RepID=UPI002ED82CE6